MSLDLVDTRMPLIAVAGDAIARGHQQGEMMRDSIAACIAIYDATFKLSENEVAARAAHFEAVTRAWHSETIDKLAE